MQLPSLHWELKKPGTGNYMGVQSHTGSSSWGLFCSSSTCFPRWVVFAMAATDRSVGIQADSDSFALLLKQCGDTRNLAEGKRVHGQIIRSRYGGDRYLGNLLVEMYGKCESLEDARAVFDGIRHKNVFSWTIMLTAYTQNGHSKSALELVQQMDLEHVKLDRVAMARIVDACDSPEALAQGKEIHARIVGEQDVVLGTALVNMYGRCGSVEDARNVFEKMEERNITSWNAMLVTYSLNMQSLEALAFFQRMLSEGVKPDNLTFLRTLDACATLGALEDGKLVHACIAASGYASDNVVGNSIINMFTKCGSYYDAETVFRKLEQKDAVSWNTMISGSVKHGHNDKALQLFLQMQQEGIKLDNFVVVAVLDACSNLEVLEQGAAIHRLAAEAGWIDSDVVVGTALVNMYGKCGDLPDARRVFDEEMPRKDIISWTAMISAYAQNGHSAEAFVILQKMQQEGLNPDKFAWTVVIAGYVQDGHAKEALEHFRKMELEGVKPDGITFVSICDACAALGVLSQAKALHSRITESGFQSGNDVVIGTALINMYGNCQSLVDATKVLDSMLSSNVISWTSLIVAYEQNGENAGAIKLYHTMQLQGLKPDTVTFISTLTACANLQDLEGGRAIHAQAVASGFGSSTTLFNTLLDLYGKCGDADAAKAVFDQMLLRRDVVSWNAIISAYSQNGHGKQAFKLLQSMLHQGAKPDKATFVNALDACAGASALAQGMAIHALSMAAGVDADLDVANTLVHMYSRCGSLSRALDLFRRAPRKNVVTWSAMVAACAHHVDGNTALEAFQEMLQEGVEPNTVTFVSVLTGCSHAGLVDEALRCLDSMASDHALVPGTQHYACMVDLLGRAGMVDKAEELVSRMPGALPAWNTLLGACMIQGDLQRGTRAADNAAELGSDDSAAAYVSLSNIISTATL